VSDIILKYTGRKIIWGQCRGLLLYSGEKWRSMRKNETFPMIFKMYDMVRHEMIWCNTIYDMVWYDIWYDAVWYICYDNHTIPYDTLRYDMIYDTIWWYGMIYVMIWYDDMLWYDLVWYDMVWYNDMIWYDMTWYDIMIWYGMIWYMIFIYCNWVFSLWQWLVNLYKSKKDAAVYRRRNSTQNTKTQNTQNRKKTYDGWNFNSGNYLFTTDTK